MKKIAIIIGGWHYPHHFYDKISKLKLPKDWEADTFVVGHRDPNLEIVSKEKKDVLVGFGNQSDWSSLESLDYILYNKTINKDEIKKLGFNFSLEPNKIGDFYFFNQWSEKNDWSSYDLFLFMHDDTLMLDDSILVDVIEKKCNLYYYQDEVKNDKDWLFLTACGDEMLCPRASFAFFDKKLIKELNGIFPMKNVSLNREGLVETPGTELNGTADWNLVSRNFTAFMQEKGWQDKMLRMSPYYRISKYCLEGERGFCHIVKVSIDSFINGCVEYKDHLVKEINQHNEEF